MRKICKEKLKLERFELPREEAIKYMEEKEEPYKVELINDLPEDAHISFYKQGEFVDLCAGPHVDSTGRIKGNGIKLTACNAAYWRGDSNRKTAAAHLRRGLPQQGRAGRLSEGAGGGREARPQQAGTRAGVFHHRGLHRPGLCPSCCPRAPALSSCCSAGWRTPSSSVAIC